MRTCDLPQDVVEALKDAEFTIEEIERMPPTEIMNNWLVWEGIAGYTDQILALARCVIAREQLDRAIEGAE